jgi:5'-methylthioadenosine phosphorylase
MIGIIGGSGIYDLKWLENAKEEVVNSQYGQAKVKIGKLEDKEVVFLARHGNSHSLMPSAINYRANISTLHQLGVTDIFSTYAVGGIDPVMNPGDFGIIRQFIDFTWGRSSTFFDKEGEVVHSDMTTPYSDKLYQIIKTALKVTSQKYFDDQVYICTQGPRFETPAEIKAFSTMGATIVGMTGAQEVILANELGISFASIAVITNLAAGVSKNPLSHQEVLDIFNSKMQILSDVLKFCAIEAWKNLSVVKRATPING